MLSGSGNGRDDLTEWRRDQQYLAAERQDNQNELMASAFGDDELVDDEPEDYDDNEDEESFDDDDEPRDDTYDPEPEIEDEDEPESEPGPVPAPSISEAADPDDSKPPLAGFQSAEDVPSQRTGPKPNRPKRNPMKPSTKKSRAKRRSRSKPGGPSRPEQRKPKPTRVSRTGIKRPVGKPKSAKKGGNAKNKKH
jgi:hypothetical protein